MNWTLELVLVPVSDVDRANAFYIEKAGFDLNVDHSSGEDFRVVQLTPPGSACSIAVMKNTATAGAAQGLHLIVTDIDAARAELVERGTVVSDFFHFDASGSQRPGPEPEHRDYSTFLSFNDPDGNLWLVQEVGRAKGLSVV